jgi:putative transposase
MMRYSEAEKMEVLRTVGRSDLTVRDTLNELAVPRSNFYDWYPRYERHGSDGPAQRRLRTRKFWNRILKAYDPVHSPACRAVRARSVRR